MGYPDSESNWTGNFTHAVQNELCQRGVSFRNIAPYDWTGPAIPIREYIKINSSQNDVWFLGWAQSPLIEIIQHKKGLKYGLVVGLTAAHFDPLMLSGNAESLCERKRLNLYDKLFANSYWCRDCIVRAYPELADKVVVTGFPFQFTMHSHLLRIEKKDNLVVFNQRFALEKLHIIEIEIARLLTRGGVLVQHLTGVHPDKLVKNNPALQPLLKMASEAGIEFVYNQSKKVYLNNLAKAKIVITTSIADMLPNSMVEAIYLGAVPLAPDAFCFPEFIHPDNLYTPYDLEEVVELVFNPPYREHSIMQYNGVNVVECFLTEMELI